MFVDVKDIGKVENVKEIFLLAKKLRFKIHGRYFGN